MKRYNKYKDSGIAWLGLIPEHWEVRKLKRILSLVTERGVSPKKLALENIESYTGRYLPTDSIFDGDGVQVHVGDIVYGKLRPYLCKVWLASFACNAIGDFYVFRCNYECSNQFVSYLFRSTSFTGICNASTYGAKMPRVSSDFMLSMSLPLPPLPEQEAIVSYLDRKISEMDCFISNQETQISYLKELKQATIAKAVTRGIDPSVALKDSGIPWLGQIPEHWEVRIGKRIYSANDGGVWGDDPDGDNDTIVLRSTEQTEDGNLQVINPAKRKLSPRERISGMLLEGDLIITKSSGSPSHIGKTSLIDKSTELLGCCYSNFIQRVRVKGSPRFYWYVFNSQFVRGQFQNLSTTTTGLGNLSGSMINNILLPLPPLSEQVAIVSYLEEKLGAIDRLIAASEAAIARVRELKQTLIADVVTGRICVQSS